MYIIPNAELNAWCIASIDLFKPFDSLLGDFAENLYNTGLRVQELKQFDRWSQINGITFKCKTEKGSNDRIFNIGELTETLVQGIITGTEPYYRFSYSQFVFYFNRFFPNPHLKIKNWNLATHTYRYNKCRLLHDAGQTDEQIQAYLGEVDVKNVITYIYGTLYLP